MDNVADISASDSKEGRSNSDPHTIPKQPSLTLNFNTAQYASFVSQRSSSLESSSPTMGNTDQPDVLVTESDSASIGPSEESIIENDSIRDASYNSKQRSDESGPSSMVSSDHHSTPLKDNGFLSTVSEEAGSAAEGEPSGEETNETELIMPGDLLAPIMGYETTEARSRFTVYKINVQKTDASEGIGSWFVFRRYSDFAHLNERLKHMFPGFRLSLPPKRWIRDNFDKAFLDDRLAGLQAFLDNIIGHRSICNSAPVRGFLCTDDPPGPHDSLEESRALCDSLEETVYSLRQELQEKDADITLLKEELELYKSQVDLLSGQLRLLNKKSIENVASSSNHHSHTDSDLDSLASPDTSQQTPAEDLEQEEETRTPDKQ